MDRLLQIAIAGTARGGPPSPQTADPAAALVVALPDLTPERHILLAAGSRAIYRQAGSLPRRGVAVPEPAPEEDRPRCSPGAERLFGALLLGEHAEVLPEALDRLRQAGQIFPPTLLPGALLAGERNTTLRPLLPPALGERGRWLARHNPIWHWALAVAPAAGTPLADDAEARWQEGGAPERLAILRHARAVAPVSAREWLVESWKGEKADFRGAALDTFAIGLGPDDEPFLEAALGDRGGAVRATAARLLGQLPRSALLTRMRERADSLLAYAAAPPPKGLRAFARSVVGMAPPAGTLTATPPTALPKEWQRDGVEEKPPPGTGERAWWLAQALAAVPPAHWEARLAATPADLVAAARGSDWAAAILLGWTRAAVAHGGAEWARALWPHWADPALDPWQLGQNTAKLLPGLLRALPAEEGDRIVGDLLADPAKWAVTRWAEIAPALPRPWGNILGRRYLDALQARTGERSGGEYDPWIRTIAVAALALPPALLAQADREWQLRDTSSWRAAEWQRSLENFAEIVRLRRQVLEEIPL